MAALLAAAALAALILPLCFSIKNVQPRSAELHFSVVAEEGYTEDDILTYQLLNESEIIRQGQLPYGSSFLLLDNLESDSRYTIRIFKNNELEKTLNFRTKPEETEETGEPATEPPVTQPLATVPSATHPPSVTQPMIPATTPATVPTEITVPTEPTETTAPTEATAPPYIPPYVPPAAEPVPPPEDIPEETINPYDKPSLSINAAPNADNSQVQFEFNLYKNMAENVAYTVEHIVDGATIGTYHYPGDATSITISIPPAYQTGINDFTVTMAYEVNGIPDTQSQSITLVPPNLLPGISGSPAFTLSADGTQLDITGTIDPNGADPSSILVDISTGFSGVMPYYNSATHTFYTGDRPMNLSVSDQTATTLHITITISGMIAGVHKSVTSSHTFVKPVSP